MKARDLKLFQWVNKHGSSWQVQCLRLKHIRGALTIGVEITAAGGDSSITWTLENGDDVELAETARY